MELNIIVMKFKRDNVLLVTVQIASSKAIDGYIYITMKIPSARQIDSQMKLHQNIE